MCTHIFTGKSSCTQIKDIFISNNNDKNEEQLFIHLKLDFFFFNAKMTLVN